jgi:hypothetical protein
MSLLAGLYARKLTVSVCPKSRPQVKTTLSTSGITINFPNGTMWDGKYIVVGDQEATSGKDETGMNEATLSGKNAHVRRSPGASFGVLSGALLFANP